MRRLTEKREISLVMSQWGGTSEELRIYNRLAEFEDFMEEQGFESLDNLQNYIKKIYKYELGVRKQFVKEINEEEFFNIKEENQKLKYRWQELKKYIETLSNESDTISEDLYFIKNKMQELEKDD